MAIGMSLPSTGKLPCSMERTERASAGAPPIGKCHEVEWKKTQRSSYVQAEKWKFSKAQHVPTTFSETCDIYDERSSL